MSPEIKIVALAFLWFAAIIPVRDVARRHGFGLATLMHAIMIGVFALVLLR